MSYSYSEKNKITCSFIISPKDLYGWKKTEAKLKSAYDDKLHFEKDYSTLSLIGEGLNKDNTVLIESKNLLQESGIDIYGISTTSYRISILVRKENLKQCVKLCHKKWIE